MAIEIETPEGIVEFPDGTPQEVIEKALTGGVSPKFGYGTREQAEAMGGAMRDLISSPARELGNIVERNVGKISDVRQNIKEGRMSPVTAPIAAVTYGGLGIPADILGSATNAALGVAGRAIKPILPESVGKIGEAIAPKVQEAYQGYQEFSERNPNIALGIDTAANLAGAILPVGAAAKGVKAGLAAKKTADAAKKVEFALDLASPKLTPTVKAERFAKSTEKGLLKKRVYQPTDFEIKQAEYLATLPIKKSNTLLKNRNIVKDAYSMEAESLAFNLAKRDVAIPDELLNSKLAQAQQELGENLFIGSGGNQVTERVISGAADAVSKNPKTAAGLLQARKDFDKWVSSQRKNTIFDPAVESPASVAIQKVRQSMNDLIAEAVPDVAVKESLAKQSAFRQAMDNMAAKGAKEGETVLQRMGERLKPASKVVQTVGAPAAIVGAGTLISKALNKDDNPRNQ